MINIDWTYFSLICESLATSFVNDNPLNVWIHIKYDCQFPETNIQLV
jgi:hypothetical protein